MVKVSSSDGAPHISVDTVISAGHLGGSIQVNFGLHEARRMEDGAVEKVTISAVHLRMSPSVAAEIANLLLQCVDNLENNREPSVSLQSRAN